MRIPIPATELDLLLQIDALGAAGASQDQIAATVGMTKHQIRHRVRKHKFDWGAETRVRFGPKGKRLPEMLAAGEVEIVAEPDPQVVAA